MNRELLIQKINTFQYELDFDKLIKGYVFLFFTLLLLNLYYVYNFYPSKMTDVNYQKDVIFNKIPIYIGFFYLIIFQVIENNRWWIVFPICIYYLCTPINNAALGFSPFVSSEFGFSFQFFTFMTFMNPLIMFIATAYVGICVRWQIDEEEV